MIRIQFLVSLALLAVVVVCAKDGYGPGEQSWGFVDVRKGAHMFYWLYYTTAKAVNYTQRPLVIWLQGGPGGSSTGIGNFKEIGSLDLYGNYRDSNWIKDMNVLFIDNPVGTGFSYVDKDEYLTKNNNQIALDLVEFMKGFYYKHPEFVHIPLHIFSQSYGGKMAAEFALELHNAIKQKEIKCKLSSIALGDPWISPMDSVLAWAPLLLNMGFIDQQGFNDIAASAHKTVKLVEQGKAIEALDQWDKTQETVDRVSEKVDFFNVIKPIKGDDKIHTSALSVNYPNLLYRTLFGYGNKETNLENLMRGNVSKALNISSEVTWGSKSGATFDNLISDFLQPAIHIVEKLLDNTNLKVAIYSGQFDLICATAGTVNWIEKMQWKHHKDYLEAPRQAFSIDGVVEGYEKSVGKFTMFWVNRAGHMVPVDNPSAMSYILNKLTNYG